MIALASLVVLLAQAPAAPPTPRQKPIPTGPVLAVETSLGTFKIALFVDEAPLSTESFLKYVRAGFYGGTVFHRVMPGFMIQGGGFTASLQEKPVIGGGVKNEARNGLRNVRGAVALARTNDPNSATSQFYINLRTNHTLDFGIMGAGYAVFGEVVEGMTVVDRIAMLRTTKIGPHEAVPVTTVVIRSITEIAPRYEPPAPSVSPSPVGAPAADPAHQSQVPVTLEKPASPGAASGGD